MKEIYQFRAWHYDEDEGKKFVQGYVAAGNYAEAVTEVMQYFGVYEPSEVEIKRVSETPILLIPND